MGGYNEEIYPGINTHNVYQHIASGLSATQFGRRDPCNYSTEVRLSLHSTHMFGLQ
jgi:hypothetical protein